MNMAPMVPVHVAICACTMDRPAGLAELLTGLAELRFQKVATAPRLTLVIADNSQAGSARAQIEAARSRLPFPVIYAHEPERGYANARNALLDATPGDADWFAFIDDDERPSPLWLDSLLATAEATAAPLIAGPVRPEFQETPPGWAERGGFFELGPFGEGEPAPYVSTNNALVRKSVIDRYGWRFDPAFNRHGGEDEHFFRRAMDAGLRAVTSADAVVSETIPPERVTPAWLFRRYRRMGRTIARIDRKNGRIASRAIKAAGWMVSGAANGITGIAGPSVRSMRGLCRLAWSAGSLEELLFWNDEA